MQWCGTTLVTAQSKVRLLRLGTFLIAPPQILPSEQWFGLRHVGNQWTLIRVRPKITPAQPICGDLAIDISAGDVGDLLFLVSGVPHMAEAPVMTAVQGPRFLYPGEAVMIGGDVASGYSLEALGTAIREEADVVFVNYAFWVRHARERQRLTTFERNTLDHPRQLIWAGDIDGDHRPDLLFDFPLGDVGHNFVLYLSSAGTGDLLVSRVASFSTPGC
jgi:hypothetical protein